MIEIIGKYNKAKVYANEIEQEAYKQILELCNQKAYAENNIAIMPDVHAGAGCTIGTTMTLVEKHICPNLVGVDIGCGLLSVNIGNKFSKNVNDLSFFKTLDNIIKKHIPFGTNAHSITQLQSQEFDLHKRLLACQSKELINELNIERANKSIGTLGGGNHFIEVGIDENENYWITVHSGSRNIGKQIAEYYQKKAIETCNDNVPNSLKYLSGELYNDYLNAMNIMTDYATINRSTMIDIIMKKMSHFFEISEHDEIETIHNYIDYSNLHEIILRKGAISAKRDELVLIPLNMRDGIILAKGVGNPDWNYSAPHGAGRLYSRSKAKSELDINEFKNEMKHIYSTCVNEKTLDESPMAYKPSKEILKYLNYTAYPVNIIKPVYNFKA